MTLEETLTSRDNVNSQLRVVLDEATGKWGIRVNRVELKSVEPPRTVQEAMEKQMRAERDRRATILTAEGVKQSQILTAEGEKQSAVLQAEGARTAAILQRRGRGEGDRDRVRRDPRRRARPGLLSYQYLQMLPQLAQGDGEQDLRDPVASSPRRSATSPSGFAGAAARRRRAASRADERAREAPTRGRRAAAAAAEAGARPRSRGRRARPRAAATPGARRRARPTPPRPPSP